MTHLRRYLEENGVLYPEQLAEAVRRQQIYGGSLDTVLLELELVDPVTLGELLERACGFPAAPHDLLENGLERPWTEIPEDMQRSRWVEPLARDGNEIVVAVHPDLPNDQLGLLLRSVRRLRPMVTPECCLEKVAAERYHSVVPQRYAVLCSAYLSTIRRRPSLSGVFDVREAEPQSIAPPATPTTGPLATPFATPFATPTPTPTPTPTQPPTPTPTPTPTARPATPSRTRTAPPDASLRAQPGAIPPVRFPPAPEDPESSAVAGAIDVVETAPMSVPISPVRTGYTVVPDSSPPEPVVPAQRDEADVLRRLEQARAVLEASRTRDAATEAIVAAAMVLSPRVGLFRARGEELVGLSTPHSAIADLGGKIVAASKGSAAGLAVERGCFAGLAPEPDLRLATGASTTTPCVIQRVEVRGRPVVFVYVDYDGAPIDARDVERLGELAALAGRVFEKILELRRQPAQRPRARVEPPTHTATTLGRSPTGSWGVVPPRIQAAYGEGSDEPVEPELAEPGPSRMSTPALEHPSGRFPPPPLVPPAVPAKAPASWRLSPDLAAQALAQQAKIEPAPAPVAEPETPAEISAPEPVRSEPELPSEVPEPGLPDPVVSAPVASTAEPIVSEPEPNPGPVENEPVVAAPEQPPKSDAETRDEPPEAAPELAKVELPDPAPPAVEVSAEGDPPAPDEPEAAAQPPTSEPAASEPAASEPATSEPAASEPAASEPAEPRRRSSEDITVVGLRPAIPPAPAVEPSERPTIEIPALRDEIPRAFTRETRELVRHADVPAEPDDDPQRSPSISKITMHSSPPPPPLPPPPVSGFDEEATPGRGRRSRSPTIHGLPAPELTTRAGATKRVATPSEELLLGTDDDEEVTIISLATPIVPATARGRIELEDEDWVAPGSQLASDSQQGLIDSVIDAVIAGDVSIDRLHEHGDSGLLRLVAQFPGPLEVLRRDLRALPPPSAHGPLIRTVIAVGAPAVPYVIDLLEHPNPDVRFYAAFVFHELRDARCMRPLGKLAFDTNGDVRIVSMRVLETYRRAEGFEAAAAIVREQLGNESRSRQLHAARAAGTLRDVGGISQLIELLASSDRFIQESALESLCSITGQQHGLKPHRWRAWYEEHGARHRVEWIIDSLRHRDLPVRRWAADELVRITGQRVPFSPMGDKRARDIAAKAWTDWWEARGRELFGG